MTFGLVNKIATALLLCAASVSIAKGAPVENDWAAMSLNAISRGFTKMQIDVPAGRTTLEALFARIGRQTGATVVFRHSDEILGRQVELRAGSSTVGQTLDAALLEAGLTWMEVGEYLVIAATPRPVATASAPKRLEADDRMGQFDGFEDSVSDYSRQHIAPGGSDDSRFEIRYDTIRTLRPRLDTAAAPRVVSVVESIPPHLALKTNLVWWAARGTANGAVEVALGKHISMELAAGNNRWNLRGTMDNNQKAVHWVVKPELRYWLKEPFNGHVFGASAMGGRFNVGGIDVPTLFDKKYRYQGWTIGAGLSYGYHLPLSRSFGLEFTAGVGVMRLKYSMSDCVKCATVGPQRTKMWVGPTNLGVKLAWVIPRRATKTTQVALPPAPPVERPAEYDVRVVERKIPLPGPTMGEMLAAQYPFIAPISEFNPNEPIDERMQEGALSIYFEQGSSTIDSRIAENEENLVKLISSVRALAAAKDSKIARIVIAGFVSPEGSAKINERLAMDRAEVIRNFLMENSGIDTSSINLYNCGVNWHLMRKMLDHSTVRGRDKLIKIIDTVPVWDNRAKRGRLGEMMRLEGGEPYRQMFHQVFGGLRQASYIKVYFENK